MAQLFPQGGKTCRNLGWAKAKVQKMLAQVGHNTARVPEGQRPRSIRDAWVKVGVTRSKTAQAHTGVHPTEQNPRARWTGDAR